MASMNTKGSPYSATATGSTTATASFSAPLSTSLLYITDVAASTDKAGATLLVQQGSTTIWEIQLATTAAGINAFQEQFATPLACPAGASASVVVTGTSVCAANISGYYL